MLLAYWSLWPVPLAASMVLGATQNYTTMSPKGRRWFTEGTREQPLGRAAWIGPCIHSPDDRARNGMADLSGPLDEKTRSYPIPICFADQATHDTAVKTLQAAIKIWSRAIDNSGVSFVPDPSCNGKWECLCRDQLTNPATVRLSMGQEFSASLGHWYGMNAPGRHTVKVDHRGFAQPPAHMDKREWEAKATWLLAHELGTPKRRFKRSVTNRTSLGHVMGFKHEHQRPDAGKSCLSALAYSARRPVVLIAY